jgi:hypothetical protein
MTQEEIIKSEPPITSKFIKHTLLFSNNRKSIADAGHGTNTFLIFCGVLEEIDEEKHKAKIFNIKTKTADWHDLSEICLEEDLGIKTELEHEQLIQEAASKSNGS